MPLVRVSNGGTLPALSDAVYITKKSGTGFTFTIPDVDGYYVVTRTNGTLPPNGTASNVLEQIFYIDGTNYYFFGQRPASFTPSTRAFKQTSAYSSSYNYSLFRIVEV